MARIVVVGGGLGGMAAAARLAKLGHEVALLEASHRLGGALAPVEQDGHVWDAGPAATLLPAALRDLFRKSGRPLEKELGTDLEPLPVLREHRFADRTSVRLPGGSRADQIAAFDALEPGLGEKWAAHVDVYGPVWDVLRRHYVEVPWDPRTKGAVPQELDSMFDIRETLHKRLRHALRDERLALVAGYPAVAEGHDLRNVPSWVGVTAYLEQCFGGWRVPGGMGRIADLLTARLATRGVQVRTGVEVEDLVVREGRVVAVRTTEGEVDADVVVTAIDPRRLPALASYVERTMPAIPPVVTHVGLAGDLPDLPHELVIHEEPLITVRPGGIAPDGGAAWTIHGRGKIAEDLLDALARHKIDIRENVVTRVDLSPRDQVEQWRGSPMGVLWQGRGTVRRRLGPSTPVAGVYAAGTHTAPGAGVPFVTQSAALVAQLVGPA
ncbi:phytoene desaturase family protein [Nocardioides daeguensis]|uniref:NAD(P)/FAD-dependent oxidoreductase n=1 Tax=Nocardioides daeguensis TaxID=908359 RepID=A0ABP6USX7_9ACTN|nr:FAD-dependent oxidoreductase [Nocardioides daeguensis]MBV6725706.1 FAD-dependent oxidoreductase [Nocardioides daeguensis]MCR1772779.1 FAD-dependent oxidoreductase [Nocardioides daeguensis]